MTWFTYERETTGVGGFVGVKTGTTLGEGQSLKEGAKIVAFSQRNRHCFVFGLRALFWSPFCNLTNFGRGDVGENVRDLLPFVLFLHVVAPELRTLRD